MVERTVIGADVSTTAVKAVVWNLSGQRLAEARRGLDTDRPAPRRFEQDARQWWSALCGCLGELSAQVPADAVAALAIAHQRETIVPVDAAGEPVGPALLWLDGRAEEWIGPLRAEVDDARLRGITGKTPNYGLSLYKIAWLRDRAPEVFARAARFLDVQSFLVQRLAGRCATSDSSADPTGLFDIHSRHWSRELCALVGLGPERLPETVAPGSVLGELAGAAAEATGLPAGLPVVAGGGDGQSAGLGVGATHAARGYLNLGTAVVAGLYSEQPSTDPAWRTLCAGGSQGYYLESSLRSGALLSDWLLRDVAGIDPVAEPEALGALERAAGEAPPGAHGLLLLPYWQGAMNPHWDERASGAIVGLTSDHGRAAIYRALVEGIALEQALFLDAAAREADQRPHELAAMGGPAASDLWCRIMADVLDTPIHRSSSVEAASEGAAMCAAAGAGLFPDPETAAASMTAATAAVFEPDEPAAARYRELRGIHADLYGNLRDLMHRLDAFRCGAE
jgi:xylulokinase